MDADEAPEHEERPYPTREEYLAALALMGFAPTLPAVRWPCPPETPEPAARWFLDRSHLPPTEDTP